MSRLAPIRRFHDDIGADCMDCDWQVFGSEQQAAVNHARDYKHKVFFTREETTVYDGREGP